MKKILAVDDSASMRQMVGFTLKKAGFDVTEAKDGSEALAIAKQATFDAIISDVNMPIMDGYEVIEFFICQNLILVFIASKPLPVASTQFGYF